MRVLVTGSQGYIGSVLTQDLVRRGHSVFGVDTGFFKHALLYPLAETTTVARDVRDLNEEHLHGIDVVVHLAGISNDPMGAMSSSTVYDPTRLYSFKLASLCKLHNVRFIFASSCSVYGIGGETLLSESSPVNPQTGYSLNKLQIEEDLASICGPSFSPIALRFATIFGSSPRIRFDVVVNMLVAMAAVDNCIVLNSDGNAWRPNLHILDACAAIAYAIESPYSDGRLLTVNVGSEFNNLRVIDIAQIIQRVLPQCEVKFLAEDSALDRDGLIRDRKVSKAKGDSRTYKVSFEKIRDVFPGFRCEWDVERGVREMLLRFSSVGLNREVFKRRGFYRLQHLEDLLSEGFLSPDLRWISSPSLKKK